jgi:hypothetical protein
MKVRNEVRDCRRSIEWSDVCNRRSIYAREWEMSHQLSEKGTRGLLLLCSLSLYIVNVGWQKRYQKITPPPPHPNNTESILMWNFFNFMCVNLIKITHRKSMCMSELHFKTFHILQCTQYMHIFTKQCRLRRPARKVHAIRGHKLRQIEGLLLGHWATQKITLKLRGKHSVLN